LISRCESCRGIDKNWYHSVSTWCAAKSVRLCDSALAKLRHSESRSLVAEDAAAGVGCMSPPSRARAIILECARSAYDESSPQRYIMA